jgi:hypothetical protein
LKKVLSFQLSAVFPAVEKDDLASKRGQKQNTPAEKKLNRLFICALLSKKTDGGFVLKNSRGV